MKKIILYRIYDDEGNQIFTREPQPNTESFIYYRLTADKGCSMINKITGEKLKVALVPEHQLNYWVEESYI
jgi:hypothetical protein